jgi:hypothetical protein
VLQFPTIDPDAVEVLTFDCGKDLTANEVLSGTPVVTLRCTAGIDCNPNNMIIGPPSFDTTGTKILQPVGNLITLNGNDYEFEAKSSTTAPPHVVVVRALLQVRAN